MVVMRLLYTMIVSLASVAPCVFIARLHMDDFERIRECFSDLCDKFVQFVLFCELPDFLFSGLH